MVHGQKSDPPDPAPIVKGVDAEQGVHRVEPEDQVTPEESGTPSSTRSECKMDDVSASTRNTLNTEGSIRSQGSTERVPINANANTDNQPQGYPNIRRWIREKWRKNRTLLSIKPTLLFLDGHYNLLNTLRSTDPNVISSLIESDNNIKKHYDYMYDISIRTAKPKPKVRLTGGFIRPTIYNVPLPRLYPQPPEISGMIRKRMKKKERDVSEFQRFNAWNMDMKAEVGFMDALVPHSDVREWGLDVEESKKSFYKSAAKEWERAGMKFSEELYAKVIKARKEKRRWLHEKFTREKAEKRERLRLEAENGETGGEKE